MHGTASWALLLKQYIAFLKALITLFLYLTTGNFYPNTLHDGNLERFFFFLATLMAINTLVFWWISYR